MQRLIDKLYKSFISTTYVHFPEGVCWTRTAERQASRMRMEYLKSVPKQEVGFYDNQTASSSTFQVISTVTSKAHSIQDIDMC